MNDDARPESRQHFQDQIHHITAGPHGVRRVNEQQVIFLECVEHAHWDEADVRDEQLHVSNIPQTRRGERLDARERRSTTGLLLVALESVPHTVRRDTATDLHDSLGFMIPNHRVQGLRLKVPVARPETLCQAAQVHPIAQILGSKRQTNPLQILHLPIEVYTNSSHLRSSRPHLSRASEFEDIWNRRIVMHGEDRETRPSTPFVHSKKRSLEGIRQIFSDHYVGPFLPWRAASRLGEGTKAAPLPVGGWLVNVISPRARLTPALFTFSPLHTSRLPRLELPHLHPDLPVVERPGEREVEPRATIHDPAPQQERIQEGHRAFPWKRTEDLLEDRAGPGLRILRPDEQAPSPEDGLPIGVAVVPFEEVEERRVVVVHHPASQPAHAPVNPRLIVSFDLPHICDAEIIVFNKPSRAPVEER